MDRLIDLFLESIGPYVQLIWSSLPLWRSLALACLIFIATVVVRRDALARLLIRPQIKQHDREIFQRADAILSESDLRRFLDLLAGDHAYFARNRIQVTELAEFFDMAGNRYLSKELVKATSGLMGAIAQMQSFLAVHFFVHPMSQTGDNRRAVLEPALNVDREGRGAAGDMASYREHAATLRRNVDSVDASYRVYRLAAKKLLQV